jgi:hypothetical protein
MTEKRNFEFSKISRFEFAGREDVEPGHGVSRRMRLIPELNRE